MDKTFGRPWRPMWGRGRGWLSKEDWIKFRKEINDAKWQRRFEELEAYKDEYGDCNVPQGWVENPELADWVNRQRVQKRKFDKGEKAYIGRVEIAGNAETKDHVIRREFDVLEGELFNGKKLRLSQENVQRLGFFERFGLKKTYGNSFGA